jgi:hypothetical protein
MTDKELLELAAKAAGYEIKFEPPAVGGAERCWRKLRDGAWKSWEPRESNDDCFRLETVLGMAPAWYRDGVGVNHKDGRASPIVGFYTDHNGDKDKARRYASTRAAAEIGKQKE